MIPANSRVLVTGHQGYVGAVLVPVLWDAGYDVVGLDNGCFRDCILGQSPVDPPGMALDLRDVTVERLRGIDAVIHLAAVSDDPSGTVARVVADDVNHRATVRLARLARDAGVRRFLFASTCEVYGSRGGEQIDEDSPLRPSSPHAVAKARVEQDLAALADPGFAPVFLRAATAFGYSPRLRTDLLLNDLVGRALLTGIVRPVADDGRCRPLVHVRDLARAFVAGLTAPTDLVHARAYNIGAATNNLTSLEVAEEVVAAVPGSVLRADRAMAHDHRWCRVEFTRAATELGVQARWTVSDGAAELYGEYLANALTADDFANRFSRLPRLRQLRDAGVLDEQLRRRAA